MSDPTDDETPLPEEVRPQCGRIWGYHAEHFCDEPADHEMQHFCECGAEADEDDLVAQEEEDRG